MPTATDEKLGEQIHEVAEHLAGLRVEMVARFGAIETNLEGFRNRVDTQLQFIKWMGVFFSGILVAVVFGAGRVVWDAATVSSEVKQQGRTMETLSSEVKQQGRTMETLSSEVKQQGRTMETLSSEVKQQGTRLDRIDGGLDAVQKQLEILVKRSAPKAGD